MTIMFSYFNLYLKTWKLPKKRQISYLSIYLGDPQSFPLNIRAFKNTSLHPGVQSFDVIAVGNFIARKLCGLLEERYVWTQSANIFVYLQQHFIVFKKCLPLAVWAVTERMICASHVPVCLLWARSNNHFVWLNAIKICCEKKSS